MKNRYIYKIIFYTIVVFCISAFSCFPRSYSKYIKEEEPVRFFVQIDKLYIGKIQGIVMRNTSNYKTVNYMLSFNRSDVMKDYDTSQQISVEIEQSSCQITSVISKGNYSINGNKATIKYTTPGEDTINVNYKCNVLDIVVKENGSDVLYTNVSIYEKFMPENVKYLYAKANGTKTLLSDYYKLFPKPTAQISDDCKQLILHVDTDNKYTEFTSWINLYSATLNNTYDKHIGLYVNSVYPTLEDILNLNNNLKGLTVTYDSVNKNYIYQIDDNFLGYAKTYYSYEVSPGFNKIAFSNSNLSDIESNQILKYYFEIYSDYSSNDIEKIMEYVSNYGSLNYILKPNGDGTYNEIEGFVYLDDTDEIGVSKTLMDYVNAFFNKKITIEFADEIVMFNFYNNALPVTYDFLTEDLITALTQNFDIYLSITKNNVLVSEKQIYNDYFVIKGSVTNNHVLVSISSDGSYTYVEVVELGIIDSLTLTQIDNNLTISMTTNNLDTNLSKSNVIEVMTKLDNYFGTNYKDEITDDLFVSSNISSSGNITSTIEGDNVIISYTITQNLD